MTLECGLLNIWCNMAKHKQKIDSIKFSLYVLRHMLHNLDVIKMKDSYLSGQIFTEKMLYRGDRATAAH